VTIYGVSQSSGVERRLVIEQVGEGVVLTMTDHVGKKERERILVQAEDLLGAVTKAPAGGCSINGISHSHGVTMLLEIDVRRNEVLLRAHAGSGPGTDVAVGLDDFRDGIESVIKQVRPGA
jgi:hypothetical protein